MARSRKKGGAHHNHRGNQSTVHLYKDESTPLRDMYHNDSFPCSLGLEQICAKIFPASLRMNPDHCLGQNTVKARHTKQQHPVVDESSAFDQAVRYHLLQLRKQEVDQSTHIMPNDQQLDLFLQDARGDPPVVSNCTVTAFFKYLHQRYNQASERSKEFLVYDPNFVPTIRLVDIDHAVSQIDCVTCQGGANHFFRRFGNANGSSHTSPTSLSSFSPTSLSALSPASSLSFPSSSAETSSDLMISDSNDSLQSPMPKSRCFDVHKHFFIPFGDMSNHASHEDYKGLLFHVVDLDGKNTLVLQSVTYVFDDDDQVLSPTHSERFPITLECFETWIRTTVLSCGLQTVSTVDDDVSSSMKSTSCGGSGGKRRLSSIISVFLYKWFQHQYLIFAADLSAKELLCSISKDPTLSNTATVSPELGSKKTGKKKKKKNSNTAELKSTALVHDHISDDEPAIPLNLGALNQSIHMQAEMQVNDKTAVDDHISDDEPAVPSNLDDAQYHSMHMQDYAQLINATATATSSFRTDTDISLSRKEDGRDPQDFVLAGSAWTAPTASSSLGELEVVPDTTRVSTTATDAHSGRKGLFGTALPSYNNTNNRQQSPGGGTDGITTKGSIGHWDQFVANEKLYGVKASFDENLYTTVLNMDSIDKTKREEAERLAREIESQTSSNIHIAEERGHSVGTDFDEEDLYSGVLKKQNPINNGLESTKKERTKMTLLARTKEQATTTPLDGDVAVNANSGVETSHTLVATTKAIPVSTPPKNAPPSVPTTIQTQPTKILMNYAVAAAKADAKSKNSQSSNANATTKKHTAEPSSNAASGSTAEVESAIESTIKATTKFHLDRTNSEEKLNNGSEAAFSTKVAVDSLDEKDKSRSLSSKLNKNAKEFTFNPGAKSFTPTFSTNATLSLSAPTPHTSLTKNAPPSVPTTIQTQPTKKIVMNYAAAAAKADAKSKNPQQFMGGGPYNPYMQHP